MLKVICINACKGRLDGVTPPFYELETLEVKEGRNPMDYDVIKYGHAGKGWCKSRFIPISNQENKQLTNTINIKEQVL